MPPVGPPKVPCPVCGVNDVEVVRVDQLFSGEWLTITVHRNGDECVQNTGEVSEAAWRDYEARRGL